MSLSSEPVEFSVGPAEAGHRLDTVLASHFPEYSRVHLRRVISAGGVTVDGRGGKPAYRLKAGQRISVVLPEIPREAPQPEDIPLDVLYEDEHLVVVNKPPGMVVHPARGHWSGTLASALQFRFGPTLSAAGGLSRPGIVHRLDRDTSGVILIARSDRSHVALARQFEKRSIEKEYFALVAGQPPLDRDLIDCPIGFHPHVREMMAIRHHDPESRPAQTFYEVIERFDGFAAVRLLPKTGRTHQIRVHLDHIGCPVLCDRQYGGRSRITRGEIRRDATDELVLLDRQALHARRLRFQHPITGESMEIIAPLPADISAVLGELRAYRSRTRVVPSPFGRGPG
ncbi:MAG: RluA family pseudouridine synthase [Thermoguttaceae bacterium]